MFNAIQLAGYIINYYKNKFGEEISSIKLQKTLYFLFAFWGGFVRKSHEADPESVEEIIQEDECLFNNKIEAWVYGPVVPDVFVAFKTKTIEQLYKGEELLFSGTNPLVKNTIDGMLDDILPISDFKLVSISHEDKCWSNNFDVLQTKHHNEIQKEDIIKEYATRALV